MKVIPTALPEVVLIEPQVHRDSRGFLLVAGQMRPGKIQLKRR